MYTSDCPFCHEALHAEELICRSCQRELATPPAPGKCRAGWFAAFTLAVAVAAGTAVLIRGFLEERRHWLGK